MFGNSGGPKLLFCFGILALFIHGLWLAQLGFATDWEFYKVRVTVRVKDCITGSPVAQARITVHNDRETYATGYTNNNGVFTKEVGIWLLGCPEEGVLQHVHVEAKKEGYSSWRETSRRVVTVLKSTKTYWTVILEVELCLESINQAPRAAFSYSPAQPRVGQEVRFDASSSSDPDGRIVGYAWNFGDGSRVPSSGWLSNPIATHAYSRPGVYTVTLTVQDNRGATATTTKSVTVAEEPCKVEIIPAHPTTRDRVTIRVSGTAGIPCFQMSHAATVAGQTINIQGRLTFSSGLCIQVVTPWQFEEVVGPLAAGTYTVRVRMENACSAETTFSVSAPSQPPRCLVQLSNLFFCQGVPITFRIVNPSSTNFDFFSCQIQAVTPLGVFVVRTFSLWGLPPLSAVTLTWDQRDSSGLLVQPGLYSIACGCGSGPTYFLILNCGMLLPGPPRHPSVPIPWPIIAPSPPSAGAPTTAPSTPPPTSTRPVCAATTLFVDRFNDSSSGWPTRPNVMGYNLSLGEYFMAFPEPVEPPCAVNAKAGPFTDFCYSVLAQPVEGPDTGLYGIVFRYQDDNNFYAFVISGKGYFGVYKRANGEYVPLVDFQPSPAIQTGQGSNILQVVVKGENMWFLVNDQELVNLTDSTFRTGRIGFYATPGLHVRFDNAEVRAAQ